VGNGIFGTQPTDRLKVAEVHKRKRTSQSRESPSELDEQVLRALQAAGQALTSSELGKRLGISRDQVRKYCEWLLDRDYLERKVRMTPRAFAGATASKPVAHWVVLSKGIEYLNYKDALHAAASAAVTVETPATAARVEGDF
jgi:predicted ArsR family transcriptional regulator